MGPIKGALIGLGLMWVIFIGFMMLAKGCVAIVNADELPRHYQPYRSSYYGHYIYPYTYGYVYTPYFDIDEAAGIIESEFFKLNYTTRNMSYSKCVGKQHFYALKAQEFRDRGEDWEETALAFDALTEDCQL